MVSENISSCKNNKVLKSLEKRLIEITYKHNLSHLNSCLSSLPIILEIYNKKKPDDKFILSNGHAGLALYVVLEYFYSYINAEKLLIKHGIHPCRDVENHIDVSTGSLGCGLSIATGLAIGNPNLHVYCIISDGECSEGIIWESLQFIHDHNISNIHVYLNYNGTSAYKTIDYTNLYKRLKAFLPQIIIRKFDMHHKYLSKIKLDGKNISAHYYQLTAEDYAKNN